MRFRSDSQRKAVFANINKFTARSETGESMRPVFGYHKERSMADVFTPESINVEGYTGSIVNVDPLQERRGPIVLMDTPRDEVVEYMKTYKKGDILPAQIDSGRSTIIPENTVILAGKDYKRYEGGKDPRMRKYRKIILAGDELFKTDEHNKEFVSGLAKIDRERDRPVYSEAPKKRLTKKQKREYAEAEEYMDMMEKAEKSESKDSSGFATIVEVDSLDDLFKD
jgi:hypothetical protein